MMPVDPLTTESASPPGLVRVVESGNQEFHIHMPAAVSSSGTGGSPDLNFLNSLDRRLGDVEKDLKALVGLPAAIQSIKDGMTSYVTHAYMWKLVAGLTIAALVTVVGSIAWVAQKYLEPILAALHLGGLK